MKGILFGVAVFLTASLCWMPQGQASQCYMPREAESEQGIRIHSELMVIGLNCQHIKDAKGENLYVTYRNFTDEHKDLFAAYERIMLKYFERNGDQNPEASLNTLRTNLANKVSNDAARMRPDVFCARYAPRIEKASEMDYYDLRKWSATIFSSHPVSKPLCAMN